MKTTIATLVMMALLTVSSAWANEDSTYASIPAKKEFCACVNLIPGNTVQFRVQNPFEEDVVLKVVSDWNIKVLDYDLEGEDSLKLDYVMNGMRKGTYTCIVEKNGKEVLRKEIRLN